MIKILTNIVGKISYFPKNYSGNIAFQVLDQYGQDHYCFLTRRAPVGNLSDELNIIGTITRANKIRVHYLENITKRKTLFISTTSNRNLSEFIQLHRQLDSNGNLLVPQEAIQVKQNEDNKEEQKPSFCSECGSKLTTEMKFCSFCGNKIE
ncbi:MAG: zinc ribbon domain-containing protein [Candidatus Lokiarchaeota archaeon]|nr:zinc ribbon domain-containing protein [Candidatus Lokiarchaeota archaeon]